MLSCKSRTVIHATYICYHIVDRETKISEKTTEVKCWCVRKSFSRLRSAVTSIIDFLSTFG